VCATAELGSDSIFTIPLHDRHQRRNEKTIGRIERSQRIAVTGPKNEVATTE
jgi:hypothetical protein